MISIRGVLCSTAPMQKTRRSVQGDEMAQLPCCMEGCENLTFVIPLQCRRLEKG